MSKVLDVVSDVFGGLLGGPDIPKVQDVARNATQIGGELTAAQLAERRAATAASGRRLKEDELERQKEQGVRPLQGSGTQSSMWS